MPRVHRGEVCRHFRRPELKYLIIEREDLPPGETVTVPVRKGGALLLTNRTPHCSGDSATDVVRWSMDLRYQSADLPTNYRTVEGQPLHESPEEAPAACYPPEADFLVRSRARPQDVVTDWQRFHEVRTRHVRAPVTTRWEVSPHSAGGGRG
jgi:hypothetical protein